MTKHRAGLLPALLALLAACLLAAGQELNVKVEEEEELIPVHKLSIYQRLAAFILQNNGTVDMEVTRVEGKGRGCVARQDMAKGQVAVKLPRSLTVPLDTWNRTSEAHAVALLKLRGRHPKFNEVFKTYWDTLPPPEHIFSKEYFEENAFEDLQDKHLVAHIVTHQAYTRAAYAGSKPAITANLARDVGAHVTFEEFRQSTAVVASYAFTFLSDAGDEHIRILLPMADMVNHGNPGEANLALVEAEDSNFYMYTTREVKKGEELMHTYSDQIVRNDYSLFHYGFVQHLEVPLLVGLDAPSPDLYEAVDFDESWYLPGGKLATAAELARLEERLASFPTTLEQDRALLDYKRSWLGQKPKPRTVFQQLALEFRYERKRALKYHIGVLKATLAGPGGAPQQAAQVEAALEEEEREVQEIAAELEAAAGEEEEDEEDFAELQLGTAEL